MDNSKVVKVAWIGLISAISVAIISILPSIIDNYSKRTQEIIIQKNPGKSAPSTTKKDIPKIQDESLDNNSISICFIEATTKRVITDTKVITPYNLLNKALDRSGCIYISAEVSKKIGEYNLIEAQLLKNNEYFPIKFGLSESQTINVKIK